MSIKALASLVRTTLSENVHVGNQTNASNSVKASETDMEHGDAAYAWLKNNHPDIHHYLKNDAHLPIDPVQTIKAIKQMGPTQTMSMIKQGLKLDTQKMYEPWSGNMWGDHIPTHLQENTDLVTEGLDMDVTWKKHGDKVSQRLFDHDIHDNHKQVFHQKLKEADPTEHKEYAPWIASRYATGGEVRDEHNTVTGIKGINHIEDFGRVHQALSEFHEAKTKKKLTKNGINADINTYKSLPDLEDAVDKIPKEATKKEELKAVKEGEATKYDTEHWTTIIPHTHAAAKAYGAGTKWCTTMSSPSYFNGYNKDGPMHILVPKNPKYPGEKYQYHLHSNQFMDPKDAPVDVLDTLHGRPNPVLMDHVEKHQDLIDASASGYGSKDKARMIQIAHDPKKYLSKYLATGGPDVQSAVARLGTPEQKEALIHNPNISEGMKINFIKGGVPHHIEKFVNDTSPRVQAAIAQHGTDEHRDKLIQNSNLHEDVKAGLVASGKEKYIKPFLDDKSKKVHQAIFAHGSEDQKDHLLYKNPHIDLSITRAAIESKEPRHLDNLINHPEPVIRALVAKHGTDAHREVLKNDPSFLVKTTASGTSTLNK